jgi:hypothetical protein
VAVLLVSGVLLALGWRDAGMRRAGTAEQPRGVDPSVVAVACSGHFDGGIGADPAAHGFQGVLAKPYLREDLSRVLGLVTPAG